MTVCLCMIVKDESAVIRRCLESVRPLIDAWCIVDTGSTDGTQALIRDVMHGVPGELHERPWVDFAANRSEALQLARSTADYSLVIDADDVMTIPSGFVMPELTADSYTVDISFGILRYRRAQIFRNAIAWRYRGVLHEFPEGEGAQTQEHLPLTIVCSNDGARRQDPDKYRKDAALLEHALETETDPFMVARYTFYLAQSWRDCGEYAKAEARYQERAQLGFWPDEVFISLLNAGRLLEVLRPTLDVSFTYERANVAAPHRAEALYAAAFWLRRQNRFEESYQTAKRGIGIAQPSGALFVEQWIYEYGLLDELAVSGYWSGHFRESVDACEILLSERKIPAIERVTTNANFARRALLAR